MSKRVAVCILGIASIIASKASGQDKDAAIAAILDQANEANEYRLDESQWNVQFNTFLNLDAANDKREMSAHLLIENFLFDKANDPRLLAIKQSREELLGIARRSAEPENTRVLAVALYLIAASHGVFESQPGLMLIESETFGFQIGAVEHLAVARWNNDERLRKTLAKLFTEDRSNDGKMRKAILEVLDSAAEIQTCDIDTTLSLFHSFLEGEEIKVEHAREMIRIVQGIRLRRQMIGEKKSVSTE